MNVIAVIQARMGSTRLGGKTLMQISRYKLLDTVINAAKRNTFIDKVIIATTSKNEDDVIEKHCKDNNISVIRGDSENVLSRFITIAKQLNSDDIIIRITADNPFNNSFATKKLFEKHLKEKNDYTFVEGLSHVVYEFLNVSTLLKLEKCTDLDISDKEHVTMYLRKNKNLFKTASLSPDELGLNSNLDNLLTVDSKNDFNRLQEMKSEIDIDEVQDFKMIYNWLINHSKN